MLFVLPSILVLAGTVADPEPNMHQTALDIQSSRKLQCGACLAVADSLHRKLITEQPQACIAKGRLDSRGKRDGTCVKYRLSEMRLLELMEGLCVDMIQYVRAVYPNGTEPPPRGCSRAEQVWNGTACLLIRYERYDGRSGLIQGHFLRRLLGQQQSINEGRELQFFCDRWLEAHDETVVRGVLKLMSGAGVKALDPAVSRAQLAEIQNMACVGGSKLCDVAMIGVLEPPQLKQQWEVDEWSRSREQEQIRRKERQNQPGQHGYQPHFFPDEAAEAKRHRLALGRLPDFDAIASRVADVRARAKGSETATVEAKAALRAGTELAAMMRSNGDSKINLESAQFYIDVLQQLNVFNADEKGAKAGAGFDQWMKEETVRMLAELQRVDKDTWQPVLSSPAARMRLQRQLNILRAFKKKRRGSKKRKKRKKRNKK
eukprot:g869.t1